MIREITENVVTDAEYGCKGFAAACLNYYRKAGYDSEDKTAFIQWIGENR